MPLTTISLSSTNTEEECTYNQLGEIYQSELYGTMLGYDNKKATDNSKSNSHSDGKNGCIQVILVI